MNIFDFDIGSEIVRTKPSKKVGDRSYIGEKFTLKCIANGKIYLKSFDEYRIKIFNKDTVELRLIEWDEDWEYYVNPNNVIRNNKLKKLQYIIDTFNISESEMNDFIDILNVGIIEKEKTSKIDKKLKEKLQNWISLNKL